MNKRIKNNLMIWGVFISGILLSCCSENDDNASIPWVKQPSIFSHIKTHIDSGGQLTDTGIVLPDEERRFKKDFKQVAGGADGESIYYRGRGNDQKTASELVVLVKKIAESDRQSDKVELYNLLVNDNVIDFVDPVLEKLEQSNISPEPYLRKLARWFAKGASDRGPVKFSIALLGLIGDPDDLELVKLLGKHEEFTYYTSIAIPNMLEDPTLELWELAKYVHGWGRIHLVQQLVTIDQEDLKEWLIREGYQNNIMLEYLAYTCAVSGNLRAALAGKKVDEQLLNSAGEIITALISGGPAEDINDYDDAVDVLTSYVELVKGKPANLKQFVTVHLISEYLSEPEKKWNQRGQMGWTPEKRKVLLKTARQITEQSGWKKLVQSRLSTENEEEFYIVDRAADLLGMDIWDTYWKRLQNKPLDSIRWYNVVRNSNQKRIKKITQFAVKQLPLEEIAIGPANDMGIGEEYNVHRCLDFILQYLGDYPGIGYPLVETGLKSPLVSNRNMALTVLSKWGEKKWNPETKKLLSEVLVVEPDDDIKERIHKIQQPKN